MPSNPAYLDQLLQLAALLGADAAWLLRGTDDAHIDHTQAGGQIFIDIRGTHSEALPPPALLIVHFPESDIADAGLSELRLPVGLDKEIQAAAFLSAALEVLTRIGPGATIRVIEWAFGRYGIRPSPFEARDRRPPKPAPAPAPAPVETTRFEAVIDPRVEVGRQIREQRQALDLSQVELAHRVGFDDLPTYRVSMIERGKIDVAPDLLDRINAALEAVRKERASE